MSSGRYFQESILWVQFRYLLIPRKALKILHGDDSFLWLAETFCKNMCLTVCTLLHQNHIYTDLLQYLFGAGSQSYLRCCFLSDSLHLAPNKTWLTTLMLCIFWVNRNKLYTVYWLFSWRINYHPAYSVINSNLLTWTSLPFHFLVLTPMESNLFLQLTFYYLIRDSTYDVKHQKKSISRKTLSIKMVK